MSNAPDNYWSDLLDAAGPEAVLEQALLESGLTPEERATTVAETERRTQVALNADPESDGINLWAHPMVIGHLDVPIAEEVGRVLKESWLWSSATGWMTYTGKVWRPVSDAAAIEIVRVTLRNYYLTYADSPDVRADDLKPWLQVFQQSKIAKVTSLLRGILEVDPSKFDQDPLLFNTPNGVIDLRTGDMEKHDPAHLITKMTRADMYRRNLITGRWDVVPQHEDWDAALSAMPDEVRDYLQVRFGQAATGLMTPDAVLPFLNGGGANGKSTVINAIYEALGDYAVVVPEKVLLADPGAHTTEMTTLQGARLAIIEELPEGKHLSVKRLKDLQGTPTMTARKMHRDSITWKTSHSLFVTTNYQPLVKETDKGTWRRLMLVKFPFTYRKPGEDLSGKNDRRGDTELMPRLQANEDHQLDAVLRWIVEGAGYWFRYGFPETPEEIEEDTRLWRGSSDLISAWLDERMEWDATGRVASTDMYADFSDWLSDTGHASWNDRTFFTRFEAHEEVLHKGITKARTESKSGLSRHVPHLMAPPLPSKITAWSGLRFRN